MSWVSWQVTGIRRDPYANAHRLKVELRKPAGDQGRYLHPRLYRKPASLSVLREREDAARRTLAASTRGTGQ